MKVYLPVLTCKCGHKWYPRPENLKDEIVTIENQEYQAIEVIQCPKCRSIHWSKDK